jgi:hypothetical protein
MTKEEIISKGSFIPNAESPKFSQFEIELFLPFFDQDVKILVVNIPSLEAIPEMNLVKETINELLNFPLQNKSWLKKEIWGHYLMCISNISYTGASGSDLNDESQANKNRFKIFNEDDAYNNIKLKMVWFDVSFLNFRYFNLEYKCPWETEHGIKIGVMNGKFDSIQ